MYKNHETQEKNQHLNISDLDFYSEDYELTDDLNNISGGGLAAAGAGLALDIIDHKWGSGASGGKHRAPSGGKHRAPSKGLGKIAGKIAVKFAVRGIAGVAGFALGGPVGAGLSGDD